MNKDIVFYELLDNMKDDNCPVCALIDKRIRQSMHGFLYENVNDPTIRNQLSHTLGLCNYHSTMLKNMGDPLAHALIYTDLIQNILREMDSHGKLSEYLERDGCYFCSIARGCEETYSQAFYEAIADDDFLSQYEKSGMLCVIHLYQSLTLGEKNCRSMVKNGVKIIESTKLKYVRILTQLEEIKHKNDYRFADEEWSPGAKDAWKRAVAILNDAAGLRK